MHVCLFDIDGTLVLTGGAGEKAMYAAFEEVFGTRPTIQVKMAGRTDRAIARELFDHLDVDHSLENWTKFRATYLRNLQEYLGRHHGYVCPGIPEVLDRLRQHTGVAVGLLTGNLREGARHKLSHYRIYHHFEGADAMALGGFGDEHCDRDLVAADALAAVQQKFNGSIAPERVWVVGDTPLDIKCARAIGARAVAVATGSYSTDDLAKESPDLLFADLSDATMFFERLV